MNGNLPFCTHLILGQASLRSDRYAALAFFEMIPSQFSFAACSNITCPELASLAEPATIGVDLGERAAKSRDLINQYGRRAVGTRPALGGD